MYILDRLIAAEYSKSSDRIESITMKYILILHTEKERDFIEQQDRYRRLGGGAGGGGDIETERNWDDYDREI